MTSKDQNMALNQSDQSKDFQKCASKDLYAAATRTYVGFGTRFCIVSIVANTCLSVSSQIVALRLERTV